MTNRIQETLPVPSPGGAAEKKWAGNDFLSDTPLSQKTVTAESGSLKKHGIFA